MCLCVCLFIKFYTSSSKFILIPSTVFSMLEKCYVFSCHSDLYDSYRFLFQPNLPQPKQNEKIPIQNHSKGAQCLCLALLVNHHRSKFRYYNKYVKLILNHSSTSLPQRVHRRCISIKIVLCTKAMTDYQGHTYVRVFFCLLASTAQHIRRN